MTIAKSFHELFRGLERAHGTYLVTDVKPDGEKQTGKADTVRNQVTDALWQEHLDGKNRIGIVPINDNAQCTFGAIDIDIYPLNLVELCKTLHNFNLPLNPCRSKSGGCHIYLFTNEPVPASLMQSKLKEISSLIGYAKIADKDVEVFPKQIMLLTDRGDTGNYINMPYFGGEDTICYGMNSLGSPLTPIDFLAKANESKVSKKWLEDWTMTDSKEFKDGPPCLQALFRLGLGEGQRNTGLLAVATYYHRKDPTKVKKYMLDVNKKMCKPPIGDAEVGTLAESTGRRKYIYSCSKQPLAAHCNAGLCRTRKYGIAAATGALTLTGLRKYDSKPPVWFADIAEGGTLELSTEALQGQTVFQKRCMESLNIMPPFVSQKVWTSQIQELMISVKILEAPPEASPEGRLLEQLDKFLNGRRSSAKNKEELLMGRVWLDEAESNYYFRMQDFQFFLDNARYKELKPSQIASVINQNGGGHKFFNINRRGTNCMKFPKLQQNEVEIAVPKLKEADPF